MSLAKITLLIGVCCLTGCGPDIETQTSSTNQRDYTRTVSIDGVDVLTVTCSYLGNTPVDVEQYQEKYTHDFQKIKTNFYRVEFVNHTDFEIEAVGIFYQMRVGEYRGKANRSAVDFEEVWGRVDIPARSGISNDVNFVWAKGPNTLVKNYTFRAKHPVDQTDVEFDCEVSLLYQ
jgi:hypothetical protein